MKKILLICATVAALTSCKSTKHFESDAYKTHYKPLKADKHKHPKCDAYN